MTGVHEQSYLAHLAAYAGCLQKDTLGCPTSGANEKVIRNSFDNTVDQENMIAVFVIFAIAIFLFSR